MTINATAAILLAFYVAVADRRGVPRTRLGGTVQNDILKEYIARGTYIYPPAQSMRLVTDIFEFCARELPRWNTISISGYHMREAGATAAQELAFTLADAIAYVDAARARGLDVDAFAGRLSFFFAAWSELFEEVAKFRAARRMWARLMRDRFGATNPRSMMCRFHVQTAGSSLTAQSIDNNVVRTTIQALSAVLGGTQSLHTNARDEALALPTEEFSAARPADPADPGVRVGRDRDARSPCWELLRRAPDRPAGVCCPGLSRRDRRDGRPAGRHRGRVPAAADPGGRLPGPARDRGRRAHRRGCQPLRGRSGRLAAAPAHRPERRGRPGRHGCAACAPGEMRPPGRRRWRGSTPRPAATTICSRR